MLFSRMVGGLGNQLFQTAALLKYRLHKEKEFLVPSNFSTKEKRILLPNETIIN